MEIHEKYNGYLILKQEVLGGYIYYAVPDIYKEDTKVLVSVALTPLKCEISRTIRNSENYKDNVVCPECGELLPDKSYLTSEYGLCWDCAERYELTISDLEDD